MRSSVHGHRATRHAKRDTLALRWNRVLRPNYALKLTNAPAFLSSSGCPRRVGSLTLFRYAAPSALLGRMTNVLIPSGNQINIRQC